LSTAQIRYRERRGRIRRRRAKSKRRRRSRSRRIRISTRKSIGGKIKILRGNRLFKIINNKDIPEI